MRSDCPELDAITAEIELRISRIHNWRDLPPAEQRAIRAAARAKLLAERGHDIEPGMGYDTLEERAMDREPPE